jgi:hypothetical protein
MTDEQLIKLASQYLHYDVDGDMATDEWRGAHYELLKFALAIHEDGYNKGYDRGYEEGYESSIVSSRMNTREEE